MQADVQIQLLDAEIRSTSRFRPYEMEIQAVKSTYVRQVLTNEKLASPVHVHVAVQYSGRYDGGAWNFLIDVHIHIGLKSCTVLLTKVQEDK